MKGWDRCWDRKNGFDFWMTFWHNINKQQKYQISDEQSNIEKWSGSDTDKRNTIVCLHIVVSWVLSINKWFLASFTPPSKHTYCCYARKCVNQQIAKYPIVRWTQLRRSTGDHHFIEAKFIRSSISIWMLSSKFATKYRHALRGTRTKLNTSQNGFLPFEHEKNNTFFCPIEIHSSLYTEFEYQMINFTWATAHNGRRSGR